MIRRDLTTIDGHAYWLLISQVEHARLSRLLAQHWTAPDLSPYQGDDQPLPRYVTHAILAAIAHHDDGWARSEAMPRLDPALGRPYSFMSEMPLEDSLVIWEESIAAARRIGPLAGWMVGSHFSELLDGGNHADDDRISAWLHAVEQQRCRWLDEWQQMSAMHSSRLVGRALRLLQACDLLSLWLCCDCPLTGHEAAEPLTLHWPEHQIGPYQWSVHVRSMQPAKTSGQLIDPDWLVAGAPWPFDREELYLSGGAWLVPARRFLSSQELLEARRPMALHWTLVGRP